MCVCVCVEEWNEWIGLINSSDVCVCVCVFLGIFEDEKCLGCLGREER